MKARSKAFKKIAVGGRRKLFLKLNLRFFAARNLHPLDSNMGKRASRAGRDLRKTVLIVEESDDVRDLFGEILSAAGWNAISVHDGVEALIYLRSKPAPALILLDMLMPEMDGWQFRRAQLADPELASIPVVVVSCMESVRNSALGFGASAFLSKPVLPEALLAAVSTARRPL